MCNTVRYVRWNAESSGFPASWGWSYRAVSRGGMISHTKQASKDGRAVERLRRKRYEKELARPQSELVRLQEWGSCARRARSASCPRVVTRPQRRRYQTGHRASKPSRVQDRRAPRAAEREKSPMYVRRYLAHCDRCLVESHPQPVRRRGPPSLGHLAEDANGRFDGRNKAWTTRGPPWTGYSCARRGPARAVGVREIAEH
jgi:hypothetical protein